MPLTRNFFDSGAAEESLPGLGANSRERAGYIEDLVREMERLAVGAELERLRDLLRLARQEAGRRSFE